MTEKFLLKVDSLVPSTHHDPRKKIQDWILKFENRFCVSLQFETPGSWCIKATEESTLGKGSSAPSMHNGPSYLRLIC